MSLIKDLRKLAGVIETGEKGVIEKQEEDFSQDEIKVVRSALVKAIKGLEKESRETNSSSLTKMYKQDADAYDFILDSVLKGKYEAAARLWAKQDTGCRDYIFDVTTDPQDKRTIAKFLGTTLLKEDITIDEGIRGDLRRKIGNRIERISSGIRDLRKGRTDNQPTMSLGKTKGLIQKATKNMSDEQAEEMIKNLTSVPRSHKGLKEDVEYLNEEAYNDVKFYVVLTPSKNAEFEDVFGEVSMQGLKNLVLGTPKEEIRDLLIFPSSMKQKAHDVAQDRWHDSRPAPEDEEVSKGDPYTEGARSFRKGGTNPYEKGTTNYDEWVLGYNDAKDDMRGRPSPEEMREAINADGDRKFQTYKAWKAAAKKAGATWFDGDEDISQALKGPNPYVRGETKSVGEWDGAVGLIYKKSLDEDIEQLDELSKNTLDNYIKNATTDAVAKTHGRAMSMKSHPEWSEKTGKKIINRQLGVEKAVNRLTKEGEETRIVPLDTEQSALEKNTEMRIEKEKVPAEVFEDIFKLIKEIKFKIDHLSHIDPTYQEHGYGFQFMILLQQIADMLKQGTEEAFKEAATKLQSFENVALVQVPDSLWKFLSVDMYKTPEQRKSSLSAKFQEIKRGR